MGRIKNYDIDGILCFECDLGILDEQFFKIKKEEEKSLVCPFSGKEFKVGDEVIVLASNGKLFPNTMILKSEFIGESDFHSIAERYQEFKKFREKYRFWL